MISLPENIKSQYKAYEREIKVVGNLYLAKRRPSNNLIDQSEVQVDNCTFQNNEFIQTTADTDNYPLVQIQSWLNGVYIQLIQEQNLKYNVISFSFTKTNGFNQIKYKVNGAVIDTGILCDISHLENGKTYYIGATFTNITQGQITFKDLYINDNNGNYEEYGVTINDYGNTNLTSKNLLNAQRYFARYYSKNRYIFSKNNYYYNETYYIDINEIGLETETDYIYSINILNNYNDYDEAISIVAWDENYNFLYETSSLAGKTGLQKCPFNLPNDTKYILLRLNRSSTQETNTIEVNNIQITEGNEFIPYELYNSSPFRLIEDNECKILDFNISEKTDPYYTSLPYNEMTIEVDNEKGYFTDYDPDNILNKLNNDCYVDLFMKINTDDYYKIMTMQFDKISSSDYEKAKLSFKSCISLLKDLPLRDKNKLFSNDSIIYKNDLLKYFYDNYKLNIFCDNSSNDPMYKLGYTDVMTIESILLHAGTKYGTLEKAVLTLNDTEDRIIQRTWKKEPQDIILLDYQAEKPVVKREDVYRGVHRKYINQGNWDNSTETFNYTLNGKLTMNKESIILFNSNYKIKDVTISDITVVGNVSVNVYSTTAYETLNIIINGNIGEEYTITINKANMIKNINNSYIEENIGLIDDTTKILKITEIAPLQSGYYQFILSEKQMKSNIEARIFGLPYLEIGDAVEIETELAKILMTITEIDMNYDGGLTETIKGYELGWDTLFPADDLYPSDDLYPNTPII